MTDSEKPNPLNAYPDHVRAKVVAYYNALKRVREEEQKVEVCLRVLADAGIDPVLAKADAESTLGLVSEHTRNLP